MRSLAGQYTIVIVTHNMAQARRISDDCIFMLLGNIVSRIARRLVPQLKNEKQQTVEGRYGYVLQNCNIAATDM